MENDFIIKCIDSVAQCIIDREDEIESLDRAIGDGDHYINIKRGSSALQSIKPELEDMPTNEIFKKIGMTLMTSVGGASGPLFASFFLSVSKHIEEGDNVQKLDEQADIISETYFRKLDLIYGFISEERDNIVITNPNGKYIITIDPLDGSQNLNVGFNVGAIFGVYLGNSINNIKLK